MFLEQIFRLFAGLLLGSWVARYLGPDQFGVLSYALAFTAILSSVAKLGLDSLIVQKLVVLPEKAPLFLGTAFWLKLTGAFFSIFCLLVLLPVIPTEQDTKLFILIISSGLLFQSFEVIDFFFQSQALSKFISLCKLIQLLISSIIKIYLIYTKSPLINFVIVSTIDQITLAATYCFVYKQKNHPGFFSVFDSKIGFELLQNSWPLMLSSLVALVYMRIDQIMIDYFLGDRATGIYSATVKVCEVWYFVPVILNAALFPAIINAKRLDSKIYQLRLERFMRLLIFLSFCCAFLTTVFGREIILMLFGPSYLDSLPALKVHSWAGIFVSLGVGSSGWFINEGLQRFAFYRTGLGALINIFLNFFTIPRWGLVGAASATLITQAFSTFLFDAFSSQTRGLFLIKLRSFLSK